MQKPLDITSLMEHIDEAILEEPHDAAGTGARHIRAQSGHDYRGDIGSDVPLSEYTPAPVQTEPSAPAEDAINPSHYRRHPSGIECIEVTRHMNFNVGNAIKYLWRYMDKGDPVENLKKAQWYIDDEIRRLQGMR